MKYLVAALAVAGLSAAQSSLPECSGASTVTVVPTGVTQYPVVISTYIANNGVININNNIDITINNAPTTLSTTVTATSTIYSTVTAAATPTATTIAEPIILAINSNIAKNKRQTGYAGYLGAGAGVASTCGGAQPLTLTNGQLFTTSGLQFSANAGEASISFEASSTVGTITTTFGVNGLFIWTNGNFSGGEAQFCQSSSTGAIQAGLTGSVSDCVAISFTAILASSCGSNSTSSGVASSTGASSTAMSTSSAVSNSSSSSSSSSSSISVSPSTTSVSLSFPSPTSGSKVKRQSSMQYLMADGTFTSNASDAGVFDIVNGQMFAGSAFFGANPTDEYKVFSADSDGTLDTTFQASPFLWFNSDFGINSANTAEFGIASGTVYAALQTFPGFLTSIAITALPAASTSSSSAAASSSATTTPASTSATITSSVASVTSSSSSSSTASISVTNSLNATATNVVRRYNIPQLH